MMRILMFGWEYPPHITGGLGTASYWLANALTAEGVKIDFVVPESGDMVNEWPHHHGSVAAKHIKVEGENLVSALNKLLRRISIPSKLSPYGSKILAEHAESPEGQLGEQLRKELARFNKAAAEALKEAKYDLIHAHDWPTFEAAMLMQSVSNKPLILHVHSTEIDRNGEHGNEFVFKLEKEGFDKADKIITVSQYTKNVLTNHYDVNDKKIEVVYHGVPEGFDNRKTENPLPEFGEKVVTFCGRITHQKGPSYFVNAASKLSERTDQIRFVMAGDGDLKEKMIELTAELGISKHFHFSGFLTKEELNRLWQITDVLVMPSVSEPFGLTGVEAMSADLPIIISRQSGLIELFPHVLQIDYWETDALANMIFKLINDPETVLRQKKENRRQLDKLSWKSE